ncbi:MAG: hypothetical protein SGILL_008033 [Bacillariaceae sp.]
MAEVSIPAPTAETEPPKFLGCTPDFELPVDYPLKHMEYAKLKRSIKLPKLHSDDRDFHHSKSSKDCFMNLWQGNVEMHWKEIWNKNPDINGLYLCIVADDKIRELINNNAQDDDDEPAVALMHDKYVLIIRICQVGPVAPDSHVGYSPVSNLSYDNSPIKPFYHLSQLEALMFRMIHRFYRLYANALSLFFQDQVHTQMHMFYMREQQWFSEDIDNLMIWSDVKLFTGSAHYETQAYPMLCLAKSLQAKGRFVEACKLYEDVVNFWGHLCNEGSKKCIPRNSITPTMVMKNCGYSYRHANLLAEAERCFVRSLWIDVMQQERSGERTRSWCFDDITYETLQYMTDVYALYHIVKSVHAAGLLPYDKMPDITVLDPRLFPLMLGLVHTAGQDFSGNLAPLRQKLIRSFSPPNVILSLQQVKNKFVASPMAARKALKDVVSSRTLISVEQFRKNLYKYHNTNKSAFVLTVADAAACLDQLSIGETSEELCKQTIRGMVHRASLENPQGLLQMAESSRVLWKGMS